MSKRPRSDARPSRVGDVTCSPPVRASSGRFARLPSHRPLLSSLFQTEMLHAVYAKLFESLMQSIRLNLQQC
jgi:hypothetical protein